MLDDLVRSGVIVTAVFGTLNLIFCTSIISLILYHRYVSKWKPLQSQNVSLILCLLAADILQSLGFVTGYRWLQLDDIDSGSKSCTTQAFFIELGDSTAALFVCAIALHTLLHFLRPTNPKVPDALFSYLIAAIWVITILMAIMPAALASLHIYGNVGLWCWIVPEYPWLRFALHYLWLFLAQMFSIVIYSSLGVYLWLYGTRQKSPELRRVATRMFLYPVVYTLGTLPLAIVRSLSMSGHTVPLRHIVGACIAFSSLGSINCAVYFMTRRAMLRRELDARSQRGDSTSQRPLVTDRESYLSSLPSGQSKSTATFEDFAALKHLEEEDDISERDHVKTKEQV